VLGNAKLLPPIVPVKRETLQVVSVAMTGLMRGWRPSFPHSVKPKAVFIGEIGQGIRFGGWRFTGNSIVPPGRSPTRSDDPALKAPGYFQRSLLDLNLHSGEDVEPFLPPKDVEPLLPLEERQGPALSANIERRIHIRPRREPEEPPSRQGWGSLRWTRVAWLGPTAFARFIDRLPVEGLRSIVS
jgi:hypothetical protein